MKLSIITPCSRPMNLPTIYHSILRMKTSDVEWLIIYDSDNIDKRILQYESYVPIKLFNRKKQDGDSTASMQRNIGIDNANGDYLYFLDDDNLIHPLLYQKICLYANPDKLLIVNQFSENHKRRIKKINFNNIQPGYIDTAQIIIPSKCKTRWDNTIKYIDEYPYLMNLISELGKENIIWIDRLYSYRNYLRRFDNIL